MSDSDRKALAAQIAREEARLTEIAAEQAASRQRLEALRAQLATLSDASDRESPQTNEEKVALFRSLFRGRTEVFPKYWQNRRAVGGTSDDDPRNSRWAEHCGGHTAPSSFSTSSILRSSGMSFRGDANKPSQP